MKTVIISDLHLGASNCCRREILRFLDNVPFDHLILNGDILDGIKLHRLSHKDWAILDKLRQISLAKRLTLLLGNHDYRKDKRGSELIVPRLLHSTFSRSLMLDCGGTRYLVTHGDAFDPLLKKQALVEAADWVYRLAQELNRPFAGWLKEKSKRFGGALRKLKHRAVAYASLIGCGGVIIGHTHHPKDKEINGVHYLNCGCWTEAPGHYVLVEDGSKPRLCSFS